MLGELEATLEGARGNALMQELAIWPPGKLGFCAADRQRVLARLDGEVILEKPATASVI